MFNLSKRSQNKLTGVHPELVRVVRRAIAISHTDFTVIEGLRSIERQKSLYNLGQSKTLRSRHLTGHAVDLAALVDGVINWEPEVYANIAQAMKAAASELDVPVQWGGDWKTFKDYVHWQLPHDKYPA